MLASDADRAAKHAKQQDAAAAAVAAPMFVGLPDILHESIMSFLPQRERIPASAVARGLLQLYGCRRTSLALPGRSGFVWVIRPGRSPDPLARLIARQEALQELKLQDAFFLPDVFSILTGGGGRHLKRLMVGQDLGALFPGNYDRGNERDGGGARGPLRHVTRAAAGA